MIDRAPSSTADAPAARFNQEPKVVLQRNIEMVIYLVGVAILGLCYTRLKAALPPLWFLGAVFAYLIGLRLLGRAVARLGSAEDSEG